MNISTYMSIHVYASSSFHQDAAQNTPMSAMQKSKGSPSTKGATRIGATPILGTWVFFPWRSSQVLSNPKRCVSYDWGVVCVNTSL